MRFGLLAQRGLIPFYLDPISPTVLQQTWSVDLVPVGGLGWSSGVELTLDLMLRHTCSHRSAVAHHKGAELAVAFQASRLPAVLLTEVCS